jgi:2-hydroxychromene-2-carboxylate isomerase
VQAEIPRSAGEDASLLSPPFDPDRDRVEGPPSARATLVVFGAHGTAWSRPLGRVLAFVRERHLTTVQVGWRHDPEPATHTRAAVLALAAEAAAASSRFWALTRELLELRHYDPADLHAAILRAGLDPGRTLADMREGTGTARIVDDVASALASGVAYSPALFVNGERYQGELDPGAVSAALEAALGA